MCTSDVSTLAFGFFIKIWILIATPASASVVVKHGGEQVVRYNVHRFPNGLHALTGLTPPHRPVGQAWMKRGLTLDKLDDRI